jgi:hypothetical protein
MSINLVAKKETLHMHIFFTELKKKNLTYRYAKLLKHFNIFDYNKSKCGYQAKSDMYT